MPGRQFTTAKTIAAEHEIIGRISACLNNGRKSTSIQKEHRHFDHGYVVTSHSAQGLTTERVLINADTSVHPDLLNSRFGYVSISRASHDAMLFTDNIPILMERLSAEVSKTSAVGPSQMIACENGIAIIPD